jgi:hypothetical protein
MSGTPVLSVILKTFGPKRIPVYRQGSRSAWPMGRTTTRINGGRHVVDGPLRCAPVALANPFGRTGLLGHRTARGQSQQNPTTSPYLPTHWRGIWAM